MATSFHFYLKNRQKNNGEYPIYLRITNNRKHKYVSTGLSVLDKHWNENASRGKWIRRSHKNYKTLNETLEAKLTEAENAQADIVKNGGESAKAIRERIKNTQTADFFELGEQVLKELEANKKFYASKTLKVVLGKFENYEGERSLPLHQIDATYLEEFEQFLRTEYENGDSTINKNFEPIRKIINRALKAHLMARDPFKEYDVPTRNRTKPKTKLTIEQIRAIEALELKPGSWEWHVRNAFLFSFYSGGIRFGDICCLTWDNVKDGKLSYQMNKNEKPFSSDLNDFQKEILSRYSGANKEYIFPFLNSHKDYSDPVELRRQISAKNVLVNGKKEEGKESGLKLLAKMAGIKENVSFHVSRHSFAQYAVSIKGLSMYEAMQALKHSKIETTQRYLKGLDEELANKAMKRCFDMDDNWIELHLSMGAKFGNKYSHTIANGGLYYYWNKSNDKLLNKPDFNWKGYFDLPEPIDFESTKRPTGKTEKVEFPAINKFKTEKKIIEFQQSEPTGYLIPRFRFINAQFYKYEYKGDEYRQALKTFEIDENGTIPPEKIPLVSNYRDTLLKQLYRQANKLNEFNRQIANVLKVYYYESEQAILKGNTDEYSDEEIEQRVKDRSNVLRNLRNLFEALILSGAKTELIERHSMLKKLNKNSYISEHLIGATIHGVLTLSKKKDPLIDMAVQLAYKINPLESILEDAFLNDRVKSKIQFEMDERFKQLPEPETVADTFYNREENKAGKYKPEIITKALSIVREYIFNNELTSIDRKVRTISKQVQEQAVLFKKTDLKTIDEWVKFYWNEYIPTDQAQTKH